MASAASITTGIASLGLPKPHPNFVTTQVLQKARGNPPLPALIATTKHRLLAADFTAPFILESVAQSLPSDISNPAVKEARLEGPIFVQVLAVEDLSKSRWEQIEAIEAVERGEATRGREVIRVVPEEGDDRPGQGQAATPGGGPPAGSAARNAKAGPHKLVLQDVKGQRVFGFELKAVDGVGLGMSIGCKMVLRGVVVARGMVMMEPGTAKVLGGKIDELHKAWLENRKTDLKAAIEAVAE